MAKPTTYYFHKLHGKVKGQSLRVAIDALPEGQYECTIRKAIKRRSSPANRYFHGVVLVIGANAIRDLGTPITNEELKEYWKRLFSPMDVLLSKDGEIGQLGKATSEMEDMEFGAFVDNCVAWCAERGIIVPAPGEQTDLQFAA